MGSGSRCAIGIQVVDGEGVAVDAVSDINRHVLGTHRTSNDRQVRCVAGDGGRGDAVGSTVVEALDLGRCSHGAVGILVIDG